VTFARLLTLTVLALAMAAFLVIVAATADDPVVRWWASCSALGWGFVVGGDAERLVTTAEAAAKARLAEEETTTASRN
jgi:hypothetical protein